MRPARPGHRSGRHGVGRQGESPDFPDPQPACWTSADELARRSAADRARARRTTGCARCTGATLGNWLRRGGVLPRHRGNAVAGRHPRGGRAATLEGRSDAPGYLVGADDLIPAGCCGTSRQRRSYDRSSTPAAGPPSRTIIRRALWRLCPPGTSPAVRRGAIAPPPQCDPGPYDPLSAGSHPRLEHQALCRLHHILKTFWGWRDGQLPDSTVIWTSPTEPPM